VNYDEMDGDRLRLLANRNCYRLSRVSWALLKFLVDPSCKRHNRSRWQRKKQEAQLSLEWPTVLVVGDLLGHLKSTIFLSHLKRRMLLFVSD